MKIFTLLLAACAIAGIASAETARACPGSNILIPAHTGKGTQTVIVSGSCAREIVHTLRPGEPVSTTLIVRRTGKGGGQAAHIRLDDQSKRDFNSSSSARIIRVR